jgi:hypothetical protein
LALYVRFKVIKKLKHITVSERNYFALKQLGDAADSFNDVITEVLKKVGMSSQFDSGVGAPGRTATTIASSQPLGGQKSNDG